MTELLLPEMEYLPAVLCIVGTFQTQSRIYSLLYLFYKGRCMERNFMTKEGLFKLKDEIESINKRLKGEIAQEIGEAREKGDLKENAEYDAAKEKQARLGQKMNSLARQLSNVEVINPKDTPADLVSLGQKVTLRDLGSGDEFSYSILGESEMDIEKDIISYKSPLAKGLIGHKIDEEVDIQLPRGPARYKIIGIEYYTL